MITAMGFVSPRRAGNPKCVPPTVCSSVKDSSMFKKVALAALMAAIVTSGAQATTVTSSFAVTANLLPTCTIDSVLTYNFGTIGGTSSLIQNFTPSPVLVTCSNGLPYSVTLGSANAGGPTGFQMVNAGKLMAYSLFANSFGNPQWDATAGGTFSANGAGAQQNISMYGLIPVQTPPVGGWPTGSYNDTVLMTLTY